MSDKPVTHQRGGEYVYDALVDVGVKTLVGLPGTQTLPLDQTVARRDKIAYVMARHETAIPHIAWGYYEASGDVAATVTVPGPGDTNAAHGLKNAYDDNVPIIHISADASPEEFGKHPIHEIDPETFDNVVKANINIERPSQFRAEINRGIEIALTPPFGPVRLGIPSEFLASEVVSSDASVSPERIEYATETARSAAVELLAESRRPVIYAGGGARRSEAGPAAVAAVANRLDSPVAVSVKGKGVFPEDDSRYLGSTGGDFPAGARGVLEAADVVLAIGCDFDGPNTANWSLPMGDKLIHINLDPAEIDVSYDTDIGIVGDAGRVCSAIAENLENRDGTKTWNGRQLATAVRKEYRNELRSQGLLGDSTPLGTPAIMQAVREAIPDETVVTTDIGAHRVWSKNSFPVYERKKYVTAGSWAGMGVGLPSAIGAKLAQPELPVVCLSGDGSLLMCTQELHTAAEYDLDVTLVLLNDADYGAISKSSELDDEAGNRRFSWSSPDWISVAKGFGCQGRRASSHAEVIDAVEWALDTDGPTLIDIAVDPDEPTPYDAAEYETDIDPTAY